MVMKQMQFSDSSPNFDKVTLDKILSIEKDVLALKLSVLKKLSPTGKKLAKLKGIISNVDVTEEDILSAQRSLYGKAKI
jgi:hypothetical protein